MKSFLLIAIAIILSPPLLAQEASVTDEELMKYATVMDSVNEMSATIRMELADLVKQGEGIMTTARYNDLSQVIQDSLKLGELKATPEEIRFVKEVAARKEEEMSRINTTFQTLAKEYVTAPVFNKVKRALTSDMMLRKRYDSLMVELGKDDPAGQP